MYKFYTRKFCWPNRHVPKILLIMKLSLIIMIVTLMQVSAATFGQNVTIKENRISLEKVFKEIRKQTGYNVFLSSDEVELSTTINVDFSNVPLTKVITKILDGLPLTYSLEQKTIVIKEKEKSLIDRITGVFENIDVSGKVVDEKGLPLPGATIKIKGTSISTSADEQGEFILKNVAEDAVLEIYSIGYLTKDIKANSNLRNIVMAISIGELDEVVVSTGYQTLSKERVTGSVTVIDNRLLNRSVSPDLLSRLKGVTNGLLFSRNAGNNEGISVRGRSTINSDTKPLIVIDNFPFEGDLNSINPNDVENVTILKDAAAASIWGVRAGNGVMVITTKRGQLNRKMSIDFNSNVTIGEKPDLFYQPRLSSSNVVELEKFLFDKGKYRVPLRNNYALISPVIELLSKRTTANATTTDAQIEALKNVDSRNQISDYFYQKSIQQQYFLAVNGGGANNAYNLSAGFDRNQPYNVGRSNNRYTLKASNSYFFLENKLTIGSDIAFTTTNADVNSVSPNTLFPYERIADEDGNPLAILKGDLRASYTDVAGNGQLLNWKFLPLDELRNNATHINSESTDIRMNANVKYVIFSPLTITANYQYFRSVGNNEILNSLNSFDLRNEINQLTQINATTGAITYPIPIGSKFSNSKTNLDAQYGRIQADYHYTFLKKHNLSAIAGYEIRTDGGKSNSITLYGYDPETKRSLSLDNITLFPYFYNANTRRLENNPYIQSSTRNNNLSYYGNLSYAYDDRIIVSGSFRKDESNLFGVTANQKGVPLWSAGAAWNIDNESFFESGVIEKLQLKTSFGYSGNVNRTLSAYTTAVPGPSINRYNALYLNIANPPNPSLTWERVKNFNIGVNFGAVKSHIRGSIEFYLKEGIDLIGTSSVAKQTGVNVFTGNVANTRTKGVDIELSTNNLNGQLKWETTALLNLNTDKITDYMASAATNQNIVSNGGNVNPLVGYPIQALFSFPSVGLDATGNPRGLLNGNISKDYTAILNSQNRNDLIYHGSIVPTIFGGIRNSFSYKGFECSFNISYKFGYYFKKQALLYGSIFNGSYDFSDAEYNARWKSPGDENTTHVPVMVYPEDPSRDNFYLSAETNVLKGDHIRFNDIQLKYKLNMQLAKRLGFKSLSIYSYFNNIGIIWRANKEGIDPDASGQFPNPRSASIGITANF